MYDECEGLMDAYLKASDLIAEAGWKMITSTSPYEKANAEKELAEAHDKASAVWEAYIRARANRKGKVR